MFDVEHIKSEALFNWTKEYLSKVIDLFFVENMAKNIGKSLSKNLSGKYRQKLMDHAKQSC